MQNYWNGALRSQQEAAVSIGPSHSVHQVHFDRQLYVQLSDIFYQAWSVFQLWGKRHRCNTNAAQIKQTAFNMFSVITPWYYTQWLYYNWGMTPSPHCCLTCQETPNEGDCCEETHVQRCFSAHYPVLVTLCTRVSWVMDDLWMEWGSYQELLSSVTLTSFRRRPVECFSTWAKPRKQKRMCFKSAFLFLVTAGLPSILPFTHTHTDFRLPHSAVIHVEKESSIYSNSQIIITPWAVSRLWRGGWQAYILSGFHRRAWRTGADRVSFVDVIK